MEKITRTLKDIEMDISKHEIAIKILNLEIENFRQQCPHPENFMRDDRSVQKDEYGSITSYFHKYTCLLCGDRTYNTEEVQRMI